MIKQNLSEGEELTEEKEEEMRRTFDVT